MGVQVDTKAEFVQERNSFYAMPKQDPAMKKLGELMEGTKKIKKVHQTFIFKG
jgi:hypothetical protein